MSRLDSGTLRWRSLIMGAAGSGYHATHDEADMKNALSIGVRYWIEGCQCDDCEAARGANDDEQ